MRRRWWYPYRWYGISRGFFLYVCCGVVFAVNNGYAKHGLHHVVQQINFWLNALLWIILFILQLVGIQSHFEIGKIELG